MKLRRGWQALALLLALGSVPTLQAGAIVVAKDSPLASLNEDEVRRIFLGHVAGVGGNSITVVFQHEGPARAEFESRFLKTSGPQLTQYWAMLIFTGKAAPPQELSGDDSVRARVASSPNAIGYVSEPPADDSIRVLVRY